MKQLAQSIAYYEQALSHAARNNDPEKTLFVQLTWFEMLLIAYALWWLEAQYGPRAALGLRNKFAELIEAQQFCDCANCRARREEQE